jgi:hypothetical protein
VFIWSREYFFFISLVPPLSTSVIPSVIPPSIYHTSHLLSSLLTPSPRSLSRSHVSLSDFDCRGGINRLHRCSICVPDFARLAGSAFIVRKSYTCGCVAIIGTMDCWLGQWIGNRLPDQASISFVRSLPALGSRPLVIYVDTLFK